ncbi:MAG: ammonia-forming cytochrome c nitrite reductase subunit c552 [Thermoleophilia bacterium]
MGKKTVLLLAVAVAVMLVLPAVAFGAGSLGPNLVNEYGMHYAGQGVCTGCHAILSPVDKSATVHGRMAKVGIVPGAPESWTEFRGAGDPPEIAGTKGAVFNGGGSYSLSLPWITLGDYEAGLATEYLFFKESTDPTVLPWNVVEGLSAEPTGEWMVAAEDPSKGLYDVVYGCQRCHMLGSTVPQSLVTPSPSESPIAVGMVPNPAATVQPTLTTARQWSRDDGTSVADFMSDPTVSYPGMSIQCENCHGTGVADDAGHGGTGVQVTTSLATLGQSQVCGQCHGSYTTVAGTLGIYGYTTNQRMADFVDVNGVSGGQSYTYIPTEEEFLAAPTAYWMFPNGSNAKGGHYYYDEWAASAHSYRGALYYASPSPAPADAMAFQAAGHGHFNAKTSGLDCARCHTGEGYLESKNAKIAEDFTPTNDNVGFMGQECSVCHNAHPADLAEENVVRAPDAAGSRSAAGLSVGNSSICEDCHNWQYEVQGTLPVVKPLASLSSRGGPSHPQRETYQGRVMLDVPAAGQFMPGAKCEECHMPKTNKAANRIAHGMKPMLPGDAEEWMGAAGPAYQGEDSCSNCHAGETRAELQANIDAWQADAAAAAADAAAAITAAQARAQFSLTDATNPGYILAGRATWNYKAYGSDASGSVHNPEYVVDGLEKAKQLADSVGGAFAGISAPKSVVPGGSGFVSGKVIDGDGTAAADAMLVLFKNGVATAETTVSAASGTFAFLVMPSATSTYSVAWVRSGNALTDLRSGSAKVIVAKAASKTTLKASATSITLGKAVTLSGAVTPAAAGKVVKIQYRRSTATAWKALTSATLSATSKYAKAYRPKAKGAWYFRAVFGGSTSLLGSKSAAFKVTVK